MVVANMDGPLRNQVLKLIDEKKKIESEISELGYVLQRNKIGMEDSLVDGNGFPRNDIDVYQVRHARHRIICLQNDHKALMKVIEKGLHTLHSSDHGAMDTSPASGAVTTSSDDITEAGASSSSSAVAEAGRSNGSLDCDSVTQSINTLKVSDPAVIAKINFVSGGSPAEEAGLRVDDEILEFGSLNVANYTDLSQMGDIVRHSMNQRINLKILRGPGQQILEVPLTPRVWAGRGYLGCNIIPFNYPDL